MPKVVRIITRLNVGGPAIHTLLLTDRLRPRYATLLVSGREAATEGNMLDLADKLGVRVTRVPEMGREVSPLSDLLALFTLVRIIRRERPDIVHTHTAKAGFIGRVAARLCGVPVIVHTFHGNVFHGYFRPAVARFFLLLERLLARITDQIVTVAEQQRQELASLGVAPTSRISVIPLGLDLTGFATDVADPGAMRRKWGLPPDIPLVGIIARLVPVKGHDLFLDTAALIHKSHPEARFVVIGDGELRQELEVQVRERALPVVFAGWETDLRAVYAALDIVCLTSHNEGSPVALIEALSARKAIVSTAVGGVPDLIVDGETGLLVDERDPACFARAVARLLDDQEFARMLGGRGQKSVMQKYDAARLAEDIDRLYRELLARRR